MRLTLSEEQAALVDATRSMLTDHWDPFGRFGEAAETLWERLLGLELLGLPFALEVGGSGASLFELGLVYRELGRILAPRRFHASASAALLLAAAGVDDEVAEVITGKVRPAIPVTTRQPEPATDASAVRLWRGRLTGRLQVLEPTSSDTLLAVVGSEKGASLVRVALGEFGMRAERRAVTSRDDVATVTFDGSPAEVLAEEVPPEAVRTWSERMVGLRCLEMLGGAEAVFDRTVHHVKERRQFGRPIGSFQAVQHIVSNMAIAIEGARWSSLRALSRLATGADDRVSLAVAATLAADTFVDSTVWAHQLHGGMGYVRETPLHLWSERALLLRAENGSVDGHLLALADGMWGE